MGGQMDHRFWTYPMGTQLPVIFRSLGTFDRKEKTVRGRSNHPPIFL